MKKIDFDEYNDKDIIDEYVKWAEIFGTATNDGDLSKMKKAAHRLGDLGQILRERGPNTRLKLLPFLTHSHEGVRSKVAQHLLALAPVEARAVIEKIATGIGPIPSDARATIRMLDNGEYKPR